MRGREMRRAAISLAVVFSAACSLVNDLDDTRGRSSGGAGGSAGSASGGTDAGVDATVDAGDGSGGTGSGGSDAGPTCDDSGAVAADYTLHAVAEDALAINGMCNDAVWKNAAPIAFAGTNPSDNTAVCKLLWSPAAVDVLFGCCEVQDSKLESTHTSADTNVYEDDSIEIFVKGNDDRSDFGATTSKVTINIQQAALDVDFVPDAWDVSYSASVVAAVVLNGTLNGAPADTGYSIEWRMNLGFDVDPSKAGLLGFALNDRDDGVKKTWSAFGQDVNAPSDWAILGLSCAP